MADPERRPLLNEDALDAADNAKTLTEQQHSHTTSLPKAQLAIIFAIKLSVTLATQQALPYMNEILGALSGGKSSKVGYLSGLVWAATGIPHTLSVYPWGRISDRVGRVPILLATTLGLAVASIAFGFSESSVLAIIVTRSLVGFFGGSIGVMHSVVGELTDKTNASKAFPLYDIVAAVGFIVGPLVGGFLADPTKSYPRWFPSPFWTEHPYVLPSAVAGAYAFFTAALSVFALHETNSRATHLALRSVEAGPEEIITKEPPPGIRELITHPMMLYISLASGGLGVLGATFNILFVLIAYSPLDEGGLSLNPAKIAVALSIMGFVSIFLKLSLPLVLARRTTLSVFRFALRSFVATFAALPLLNLLARTFGPLRTPAQDALLWLAIAGVLFLSRLGCLGFGLVMLLVREHTPGAHALGAANGATELVQMLGALIGPPLVTSLFAFSTTHKVLGGYFWVPVVLVAALLISRLADVMIRLRTAAPRAD